MGSIFWYRKKNFAFYVEEMYHKQLSSLKNIPLKDRYNIDGTPTTAMQNLLDQVCMNGKTILHTNSDLTKNCKKGSYLDPETFHNMTDLLDSYSEYWDRCSHFVIEQQMSFGKNKRNTNWYNKFFNKDLDWDYNPNKARFTCEVSYTIDHNIYNGVPTSSSNELGEQWLD